MSMHQRFCDGDHHDTLGGTGDSDWPSSLHAIRAGIAGMRPRGRLLVGLAAAVVRRIVLHWPGYTGAIAVGLVFTEIQTAVTPRVPRETAARARTC